MLKKFFLGVCLLSLFSSVIAQDEDEFQTIGGDLGDVKVSGFLAPAMTFTQIDGEFAHMMGGGIALILDGFFIGGYGMGKTTSMDHKADASMKMEYGHGGFWTGYTFMRNRAIHPVLSCQAGWGGIAKRDRNDITNNTLDVDNVFVVTPTAEVELNFTKFFKLGVGANYSFVFNSDLPYKDEDFSNLGMFVSFKFGWF